MTSLLLATSAFAEDALSKCVASRSEEALTIVKQTAGLTQKSQLDGLRGMVKHICVDQHQLAASLNEKEVESTIARGALAAVHRVFGPDYLDAHPLK
ncbi:hypothetical protein CO669_06610 [Bradyrhizobium sp. Y36]|uniref:hypothetical protein n=1 Tax=Bradyrhizobium sp. Y36 TaxID=2035447 RepID=UPI000BE99DBC|nr:hypothetical protein [Bradyrhizobium sp. Y36]PDT91656.1 hypothetical protein CO669_06610 [Bradyrhizobium sp. Y36]